MTEANAAPGRRNQALGLGVMGGMLMLLLAEGSALAAGGGVVVTGSSRYSFSPGAITVTVGHSVTWSNNTQAPHTVTSDCGGGPLNGILQIGGGSYSATFRTAGTFAYHCNVHAYMHGVIHVTAARVPTPRVPSPRAPSPRLPATDAIGTAAGADTDGGPRVRYAGGRRGTRLRRREFPYGEAPPHRSRPGSQAGPRTDQLTAGAGRNSGITDEVGRSYQCAEQRPSFAKRRRLDPWRLGDHLPDLRADRFQQTG